MKLQPLKIGDKVAEIPIIQGGMGVGVSLSNLAAAVTNAGGIGVISTAQIGYNFNDFILDPIKTNLKALEYHIKRAKEKTENKGILGVNIMTATKGYSEYVKTAVKSGIDLIISGAGLPVDLPNYVKDSTVKIAPIVSSAKAATLLLKMWDRRYKKTADMVVIEGPLAGGHLGFSLEDLESAENYDVVVKEIIDSVQVFAEKYEKEIPVVFAGGVYTKDDIEHYINLGCKGVQIATRFIATYECDAHEDFKQAIIDTKEEDITIVKSPVGMPGRAVLNSFVAKTKTEKIPTKHCYNCLATCDIASIPYCITDALINSVQGNLDSGLIFCGAKAYKVDKLMSVQELMDELTT